LDTSSTVTSVALHDDADVIAVVDHDAVARQGELLAPAIQAVLAAAGVSASDLGRVVVGVGPGPFTGLRVGLMTARALGHALGVPVVGVVSPDTLAAQVSGADEVVVVTDARRREVYWAAYDRTGARTTGPAVERPADVAARLLSSGFAGLVVGPGAALYADLFAGLAVRPDIAASAAWAARLAHAGRLAPSTAPLYLRRPDAQEPSARKPVLT